MRVFSPAALTPSRLRSIFIATGNACTTCYWSTLVIAALPMQPSTSGSPRKYRHNRSLYPVNVIRQGKAKAPGRVKRQKKKHGSAPNAYRAFWTRCALGGLSKPKKRNKSRGTGPMVLCNARFRTRAVHMASMLDTTIASSFDVLAALNFPANPGRLHNFSPLRVIYSAAGFVRGILDEAIAGNIRPMASFSLQSVI